MFIEVGDILEDLNRSNKEAEIDLVLLSNSMSQEDRDIMKAAKKSYSFPELYIQLRKDFNVRESVERLGRAMDLASKTVKNKMKGSNELGDI